MRTTTLLVPTLAAALSLAACMSGEAPPTSGDDTTPPGDDDDGPGDGSGPSGFITAFASSECMEAHSCRASFPTDAGVTFEEVFGATEAACETMALEYYQPDTVRTAVQSGTITFDRTAAENCLANINWGTCTQYFDGQSPLPASCGQALVGTVGHGGQCEIDLECSSDQDWCGDSSTCETIPTGQ
jgi:hypothetical protein